ncbi:MAG TPA: alpha/beta fold hydrolase [Acidimicrobiales bacterium]|nr:alpha/beta fold hydrolase [Acidimicrobiales bacterium]
MPFFDGATGRVYYKSWRVDDPSAVVVFLHGFGEHSGLYHRLAHSLAGFGIELWALDEIGHGLSDGDRGVVESIDHLVENGRRLRGLAGSANPGVPIVLAGHSLGGVAAAVTAGRDQAPYRGLVLSGTPLAPLAWVAELAQLGPEAELSLDAADLSSDPFYLDELENDPLAFTSAAGAASLLAVLPPAWEELEESLTRITIPVLLVHGGGDPLAPLPATRAGASRLPDVRISEFPGARHDVLNEHDHRAVARTIADFVLSVARSAGDAESSVAGPSEALAASG